MDTPTKISLVISIAAVICMFFAAPIVGPVSAPLAVMLVIIGSFYSLGIVGTIWMSYHTPPASDE